MHKKLSKFIQKRKSYSDWNISTKRFRFFGFWTFFCDDFHKANPFQINDHAEINKIKNILDEVEMVLIMTVEPGFSGQKFIEGCMDKVKELRELMPNLEIEVDGGINDKTAPIAVKAGANVLVVSSFIFKSKDKVKAIKDILNSVKQNV